MEKKMKESIINNRVLLRNKEDLDMFRLVSNEDYGKNLNAIIAYYQISKGETKKRFISNAPGTGEGYIAS
jgi:hypothetical protein